MRRSLALCITALIVACASNVSFLPKSRAQSKTVVNETHEKSSEYDIVEYEEYDDSGDDYYTKEVEQTNNEEKKQNNNKEIKRTKNKKNINKKANKTKNKEQ